MSENDQANDMPVLPESSPGVTEPRMAWLQGSKPVSAAAKPGKKAGKGGTVVPTNGQHEGVMETGSASFGSKLRYVRKSLKKMTLQQLAAVADISPALLSQIERGATSPSLRTLTKLRTALELPSSFFFEDEHPEQPTETDPEYICRSNDRPLLVLGPGEPSKELLHHGGSRVFEFMIITVPPHGTSDPISYPSEKGGYVLEGQLGLMVDGRSTLLEPGDSFLFDGIRTHSVYNPTDAPAKVLWIIAKLSMSSPF